MVGNGADQSQGVMAMTMKMLFGYNFGKLSIAVIPQAQDKAERGDWREIDVTSLDDDIADAYEEYKDCYRLMKEAKALFEGKMRAKAGLAEPKATPKVAKGSLSLADFLAQQASTGRRA